VEREQETCIDVIEIPQDPGLVRPGKDPPVLATSLVARAAIACVIGGFGLLNVANPHWAPQWGSFPSCVRPIAFRAIILTVLGLRASRR
jgi:hypothetical protein